MAEEAQRDRTRAIADLSRTLGILAVLSFCLIVAAFAFVVVSDDEGYFWMTLISIAPVFCAGVLLGLFAVILGIGAKVKVRRGTETGKRVTSSGITLGAIVLTLEVGSMLLFWFG
ncbi:hypothetical protein [Nocardia mexicana]|uniref:Uncharacterized protein n=1 Tax=Nocardia mexicana TaxID=279262 RepID=A0A370GNP6_9NOCA|nr:hypothetical protein [Nocardia mexicana]RDI44906.1 hypothetical protein DFR68_11558 [Nocardia mexicana]